MHEKSSLSCQSKVTELEQGNHFHNILKLFDDLPNLSLTISETIPNYYL